MSNINNKENIFFKGIKAIDQMGIIPQLLYQRKNEYTSLTGGIISILIFIAYIFAFFFFGQELFLRENPTVLQSKFFQGQPEGFNLTKKNFAFFIGIQGQDWNYYIDPTIYKPQMFIRSKISFLNEDGKYEDKYDAKPYDLVKCNLDSHFENFKEQFKGQDLDNLLCPPKEIEKIELEGSFDNNVFRWLNIIISNCKNETDSNVVCKSKEEIDEKLRGGFFVVNYIDTIFDPKNFESPEKYVRKNFYTSMSNNYYKEITFWQTNIDYISESGIIFDNEITKKFISNNRIKEIYDFRKADTFIDSVFRLDYTKEITRRKYLKVQTIIAEVGGFVKGINVICSILFYFFIKTDFYCMLLEKIYFYKGKTSVQNNSENIILKSNPSNLNDLRENQRISIKSNHQRLRENPEPRSINDNNNNANLDKKSNNNLNNIDNNNNNNNNNDYVDSENNQLPESDKSNWDKILNKKNFTFKDNFNNFFRIRNLDKFLVMFKFCLPCKSNTNTKKNDIIRLSIEKIMDKFDCQRYLENFEEMKIIREILFDWDQNIIIDKLKSKKTEMKFGDENSKEEFFRSIKKIGDRQEKYDLKLKKIICKNEFI